MFFSVLLIGLALAVFCALLYNLAIFALPFAIGLQAALWAVDTGTGAIGGIAVGIVTGALVLVIGQVIFCTSRSPLIRWLLILLFAGPAAVAGYNMLMEAPRFGLVPSPIWQHVFAVIGSMIIGGTAIARLAALSPGSPSVRPRALARPRRRPTGLQKSMMSPE